MKSSYRTTSFSRSLTFLVLAISMAVPQAFGWYQQSAVPATEAEAALSRIERDASAKLNVATIREVTTTLSSPEMEGRGTAQPGGDRAAKYIADRFANLGLKPLGTSGSYMQPIAFQSSVVSHESSVKVADKVLKLGEDFAVAPPHDYDQAEVTGELIFAGYGTVSEALKRDDLAQLDVKGKIVILISGRPNNVDEKSWRMAAPPAAVFGGLLAKGATGLIFVNVGSDRQPFSLLADYLTRRRVMLADAPRSPVKLPPVLLFSDSAAEKLFEGSDASYKQILAKAQAGNFVSRDLKKSAVFSIRIKQEEGTSSNVVAVLEGSDPKLKDQAVVYTAHYDAYGKSPDGRVHPGAADNALGVAMITAIAEAFTKTPVKPRRSVVFLAVTGEEHGLLGSEYWVKNPTWQLEKIAANLNFDGIGTEIYGPVKRVVGYGAEYSELGAILEGVLRATGLLLTPDPAPEERVFFRSDHYSFVKRGVPALMMLGGPEGDPAVWMVRARKWLETDYHQSTDVVKDDWHWDGARTLATVGLVIGMRVADADAAPQWLPGAPFKRQAAPASAAPKAP